MAYTLEVKDLVTTFRIGQKDHQVLRGISFNIRRGETLCMVGESGCGKSVSTLAIMDLLPLNGKVVSGSIRLDGQELTSLNPRERNAIRGARMGMIFQEPMTALNPLLTIGYQMTEGLRFHQKMSRKEAWDRCQKSLERVGIANAGERMRQHPFQLSGGLRQRIMIAMVLSLQPSLLIADEPTTALDVTIQKQVLLLLKDLKKDSEAGILFITHDLGVVAEIADRVVVLYAGHKVEEGLVADIFRHPLHPYTQGLLRAVPNVDDDDFHISAIPGAFPSLTDIIPGCRFHPRCAYAFDRCRSEVPAERACGEEHFVCCHKVERELA
ncbi:MAG: ABC transporter ATP-binding protein [Christensenellales bacterium]